ncbi:anthrone oxygenase family protein [Arthrobacter sp. H5]|uniref:anthrone oxygenase family protein n=1 Tax=Arthrobacter sp. H5 TaxID=1267973 RepID=UPI0004ACEB58|nr:anthrone oxygenase family protein [Arthrobacter sp. H5]
MTHTKPTTLALIGAIGSGMVGGFYLAFSGVIMPALHQLPAADAVRIMQSINRAAVGPAFMIPFWGTAAVSAALVTRGFGRGTKSVLPAVGAGLYLAGVAVTVICNVPLNNKLDAAAGTQLAWEAFTSGWVPANHIRTAASIAGAVLLVGALRRRK